MATWKKIAYNEGELEVNEQEVVGRLTGGDLDGIAIGIADDNIPQIDDASAASGDYVKFTANGIEGRSKAETQADLDLEAGTDFPSLATFNDHSARHESGGGDAVKLDDLAAPDDNTDLDASTSKHGLVVKATAPAANVLNVVGIANGETAYTDKTLFDATNPAALGTVAPGTSLSAAHRDHVHPLTTKIADADGDTQIQSEESADEDKVRMDVKGVEAFLLDDAGVLTLAKQSGARAYLSALQSIPNTTFTKITLDTESFDIQGEFATNKFTASKAGTYLIIGKIVYLWQDTTASTMYACYIYRNGASLDNVWIQSGATATKAVIVEASAIITLAVNDYIELYTYHETVTACRVNNGVSETSLAISKIA